MLNSCQACWFIQLMSYDFIIQYCQDNLNSADESLWKSDYITKQSRKHYKNNLMLWQIDDLISMLVNKLATAALIRAEKQYSCQIRDINFKTENLIQVLSLQAITWSKIRLTADDFELYKETSNFDQKTVFLNILISFETEFLNFSISFETVFLNIFAEEKSILNLIKNAQEFDLLCR